MKKGWKLLDKKIIYKNPPWSSLEGWTYMRPDRSTLEYTITIKNEIVIVFALTKEKNVLMIKQYFFLHDEMAWGLVAGFVEDGETSLEAAKKELKEEAGAVAKEFVYIGSTIRGKYSTGEAHMYLALDVEQQYSQDLDPSEDIEPHVITLEECKKLLDDQKIREVWSELCARRALSYLNV